MPAPTIEPTRFAAPDALTADQLNPGEPIWVYRAGSWRPGVVLCVSPRAVMVRYRPTDAGGTAVDTVNLAVLALRGEPDPYVDVR